MFAVAQGTMAHAPASKLCKSALFARETEWRESNGEKKSTKLPSASYRFSTFIYYTFIWLLLMAAQYLQLQLYLFIQRKSRLAQFDGRLKWIWNCALYRCSIVHGTHREPTNMRRVYCKIVVCIWGIFISYPIYDLAVSAHGTTAAAAALSTSYLWMCGCASMDMCTVHRFLVFGFTTAKVINTWAWSHVLVSSTQYPTTIVARKNAECRRYRG